ncbi:MAG: hypothetical protein JWM68_766 [Verrucomicrobiales bacterium]|nr:hypothetical protein [Verrucomicrobiales bacterium]
MIGRSSVISIAILAVALLVGGGKSDAANVNLKIVALRAGNPNPVCVRAIIKKFDGTYVSGEWGDSSWPVVAMRGRALSSTNILSVPTGITQITVGKGPDYLPQTVTTNLATAGQTYTISFTLQPQLDLATRGWSGGDAHVHFNHGEHEIERTPQDAFTVCAAGGFNFASFAEEHYGATTLTRQQMFDTWKIYENSECKLWLGVEEPKNQWGHHVNILYDPWSIRSALPYSWGIHSVHEQGGVTYPVHPERMFPGRSSGGQYGLFPLNNHQKHFPLTALTGHLIDAWSGESDEAIQSTTLTSYYKLLSMGYKIPFLADSDFCFDRVNNGLKGIGCWINYFHLDGNPLSRASLCNAIRKGRALATTGPLVLFTIDNAMSGDVLPPDGSTRTVRIEASYKFNPWTLSYSNFAGTDACKISEIDLLRNGQIIRRWNPNTATSTVLHTINESTNNAYYMVRVVGNEGVWMAAYASPIYFENTVRLRQPAVFKPLIKGRLYDSKTGAPLSGNVSCVRYGKTEWTIPTDGQGRFQAYAPIDADLVAQDSNGRTFTQNILKYEQAYSFLNSLPETYPGDKGPAVDAFSNIVAQINLEFPLVLQLAASYVRTNLAGNGVMSNLSVSSAPTTFSGKQNTEIVMLLLDKTQAQNNDTINYAAIFRRASGSPTEELNVEWRGWDANYPHIDTRYGKVFQYNNGTTGYTSLGGGFYARIGSVVVPAWVTNDTPTTAAMDMFVSVRGSSGIVEDAHLLIATGPTKRELLVSATSDGLPATWGQTGIGPCNFYRDTYTIRYADYRGMTLQMNLNGQPITISPKVDTAHVADADNALFYENFYYDGQCEPAYRNIPFRDAVRAQPADPDFSAVPIQNPTDTSSPNVVLMEPFNNDPLTAGVTRFYYFIDDAGLSGAATATLLLDGIAVVSDTTNNPIVVSISPGAHTWQIKGFDKAGNNALSEVRSFNVTGNVAPPVRMQLPQRLNNSQLQFRFAAVTGQNYTVQYSTNLTNWITLLLTNTTVTNATVTDFTATNPFRLYRVFVGP